MYTFLGLIHRFLANFSESFNSRDLESGNYYLSILRMRNLGYDRYLQILIFWQHFGG